MRQALIKIIEKWSCSHDWEKLYEKHYEDKEAESRWGDSRRAHTRLILKCTKCGKLKTIII